jgi:hypothetical protein
MNPFIELYQQPVETLSAAAYALVLLAALLATWYAAGRNLLWLIDRYQDGWLVLPPFWYTARSIALILILAVDLLLVAGIVWILT